MNKIRRHKIKKEFKDVDKPTASTAATSAQTDHFLEEKDLTYYLHDRVELMHQIFSILKPKELMAMAPDCIRNLNIDDVQELCLEEVLGISSKRLCAILDGAEPPSDTETSSSDESAQPKPALEQLETISLDSISSDEVEDEVDCKSLSSKGSRQKKHSHAKKHKHSTHTHQTSSQPRTKDKHRVLEGSQSVEKKVDSKAAERAGMTVLELLELQARARAIRAQLALENTPKDETAANSKAVSSSKQLEKSASSSSESENENSSRHSSVCVKEEPPEVLEVPGSSSEDEKTVLQEQREKRKKTASTSTVTGSSSTVTSLPTKKSDLTIIVPQTQSRKIKLKRNKVVVQVTNIIPEKKTQTQSKPDNKDRTAKTMKILENVDSKKISDKTDEIIEIKEVGNDKTEEKSKDEVKTKQVKTMDQSDKTDKSKKSKTKKPRNYRRLASREGSDHDEITLQLSDTEKMDLLENFNPKNYENVSSSSCNEESDEDSSRKNKPNTEICIDNPENDKIETTTNDGKATANTEKTVESNTQKLDEEIADEPEKLVESPVKESVIIESNSEEPNLEKESTNSTEENTKTTEDSNSNTETGTEKESQLEEIELKESDKSAEVPEKNNEESNTETEDNSELNKEKIIPIEEKIIPIETAEKDKTEVSEKQKSEKDEEELKENKEETNREKEESPQLKADMKSDGEISDKSSSDIEMLEKPPEIICISDEEEKEAAAKKLKKNKKEKKAKKKSKKHSKKPGFRKAADRDFSVQRKNEEDLSATDNIVILDDAEENYESRKTVTEETTKEETSKEIGENESERRKSVTKETTKEEESGKLDDLEEDVSDINYEIYEISDESSGSETDLKLLSKEPTSEEIEELSQRIDTEIEREEIISEDQMRTSNMQNETSPTVESKKDVNVIADESEKNEQNTEDIEEETMSWKHRWLGSKKVQKVMVTSNILNAIRKKNKELKLKLAQRKNETELPAAESERKQTTTAENVDVDENLVVEGSIDHYNMLEGSTKYVNPVIDTNATELDKSMRQDAKQLMRMYKKLVMAHSNSNKSESERKAKKEWKKLRREKRKALDVKNVGDTELNKS